MAVTTGTRFFDDDSNKGITRWSADTDSLTRQQMDDSHYVLENYAVKYDQGAGTGSRPAAAAAEEGSFWYDTTNDALSYCDGSEWINVVLVGKTIDGGNLILADARNIEVNTTTGTKIGTATNQKIGFFNATPIVQPASTVSTRDALINLVCCRLAAVLLRLPCRVTTQAAPGSPECRSALLQHHPAQTRVLHRRCLARCHPYRDHRSLLRNHRPLRMALL